MDFTGDGPGVTGVTGVGSAVVDAVWVEGEAVCDWSLCECADGKCVTGVGEAVGSW